MRPVIRPIRDSAGNNLTINSHLYRGAWTWPAPNSKPRIKLIDRFFFTMRDQPWHWIVDIEEDDCFLMLTTEFGPDVAPFHKRSVVRLAPAAGMERLTLSKVEADIFAPLPRKHARYRRAPR